MDYDSFMRFHKILVAKDATTIFLVISQTSICSSSILYDRLIWSIASKNQKFDVKLATFCQLISEQLAQFVFISILCLENEPK
jgi:hypothetical protein